jgi:hypothetical protein
MKLDKLNELKQVRVENQIQLFTQNKEKTLALFDTNSKDYSKKEKKLNESLVKTVVRFLKAGLLSIVAVLSLSALFLQFTSFPNLANFKPTTIYSNTRESIKSYYLSKWVKPAEPFDFFTYCQNKKGVISSLDGKTYCTLNSKVFFKQIELPRLVTDETTKEAESLLSHTLYIRPTRSSEFTHFTVGKDLENKSIWGNTVYTANLNTKSNAISYLWLTNSTFVGENQEQKNAMTILNNIMTTDIPFSKEAQSAYIVDPKQLDTTEITITPNADQTKLSYTPNPLASVTKIVITSKKDFLTDSQLTVKVMMKIRENFVIMEETYSSSYSKFFRTEYLDKCIANSADLTAQANCYSESLWKDEDFIKITGDIVTGLVSGFAF